MVMYPIDLIAKLPFIATQHGFHHPFRWRFFTTNRAQALLEQLTHFFRSASYTPLGSHGS